MKHCIPSCRFVLRSLFAALAIAVATPLLADEDPQNGSLNIDATPTSSLNLESRLKVNEDPHLLYYNQLMFLYNTGMPFETLIELLSYKGSGDLPQTDRDSETLLGNLYTSLGLLDEADTVFSRSVGTDTIAATRKETWFNKGKIQFERGDFESATSTFANERYRLTDDHSIDDYEVQARLIVANMMCKSAEKKLADANNKSKRLSDEKRHQLRESAISQYNSARHALQPVEFRGNYGAYAAYNSATAYLLGGRDGDAAMAFNRIINLPSGNSELNAIKDRAALTLGFNFLQKNQPDQAQKALETIRLDGPYSSQALLALAWAHFGRNEYKKALAFLIELEKRPAEDQYVQESLMMTPRAYEQLGALPQAMAKYRRATEVLRKQIIQIDSVVKTVQDPKWLEILFPDSKLGANIDPLQAIDTTSARDRSEVAYLGKLLASNPFNQAFQQYEQLRRFHALMDRRADQLKGMDEVAHTLQGMNGEKLDAMLQELKALKAKYSGMQKHWEAIQVAAADAGSNSADYASVATEKDQSRLQLLTDMTKNLAARGDGDARLRDQAALLRGISLWEEANDRPLAVDDLQHRLQNTENDIQALDRRLQAVKLLLAENKRLITSDPVSQVADLSRRTSKALGDISAAEDNYRNYMRNQALKELDKDKTRISDELAEAYLNLARIEDAAINKEDPATPAAPGVTR